MTFRMFNWINERLKASRDSYAYGDVSESNLIEDLISTREGIILEGFYYTGD